MAGLLNKLRMMDAAPAKAPATKSEAPAETGLYRREAVFPLSTFGDQSYATPETLRTVFGCEFPRTVAPEDVLFLDTETTGLSGGAGTIAFQVGLGYLAPAGFVVEQFLMRDYPDEEAKKEILRYPLDCFAQMNIVEYVEYRDEVVINPTLWESLTVQDKQQVISICEAKLNYYYDVLLAT